MARRRSLILWTTGAAAGAVIVLFATHGWRELRLRWACQQVREALLALDGRQDGPPADIKAYFAPNELSYAVAARLLEDEDLCVWVRTVQAIEDWHEGMRRQSWDAPSWLGEYLRDSAPLAWLKFQLPEARSHQTLWRTSGGDPASDYWSGHAGRPLAADARVLDFLRGFLAGEAERPLVDADHCIRPDRRADLEGRAVYALGAMQAPGSTPGTALDLLRWTVTGHRFAWLRLRALFVLVRVEGSFDEDPDYARFCFWQLTDDPPHWAAELQELAAREIADLGVVRSQTHHQLDLLAHLDSSWALWALVHLGSKPGLEEVVAAALGPERGRWPVPKPVWLPLEAAAARYLASPSVDERAAALLVLVELGTPAAREVLVAHEPRETHPELRLLTRSGQAALGDELQRAAVEPELLKRLDANEPDSRTGVSGVFVPPARWPWSAEGPGAGWCDPFRIEVHHLAHHHLLAGSRATLDRVVQRFMDDGYRPLDLTRYVEGLPLSPWSNEPQGSVVFTSLEDIEEEQRQLARWWQAHAEKLRWDARQRKFVADGRSGAR